MKIHQVFIKCHDNDFWSYYRGALFSLYYWYAMTHREWHEIDDEAVQEFIEENLDSLYKLSNGQSEDKKFPWKIKVFLNEEAIQEMKKESECGNSECAYMDIEAFLMTPGATIEQFIYSI